VTRKEAANSPVEMMAIQLFFVSLFTMRKIIKNDTNEEKKETNRRGKNPRPKRMEKKAET
jgi:hypothetical protein